MKAFLPPLDSKWRLTEDWYPDKFFINRSDNEVTMSNIMGDTSIYEWKRETGDKSVDYPGWVDRYHQWQDAKLAEIDPIIFPRGTIIQFNRYHVSHSGENMITCEIFISPELRLSPKKQGGKAKGRTRFYVTLDELNSFPKMEEFTQ